MKLIEIESCGQKEEVVRANADDLVIAVGDNEIAIVAGDFSTACNQGLLHNVEIDERDFVKIRGIGYDDKIYVAERLDEDLTEKECNEYWTRKGFTDEAVDSFFEECLKNDMSDAPVNLKHITSY